MRKYILAAIVVLIGLAVFEASHTAVAKAAAQEPWGTCVAQVPQSWGQFKGGSEQSGIAFEDAHGTLRFVTNFPCNGNEPAVALVVKRGAN